MRVSFVFLIFCINFFFFLPIVHLPPTNFYLQDDYIVVIYKQQHLNLDLNKAARDTIIIVNLNHDQHDFIFSSR